MLRFLACAFVILGCLLASATLHAQTPEITAVARSADDLQTVLNTLGDRGEMFGLTGPADFVDSYGQFIDPQQPIVSALTFTSKIPMFAADLTVVDVDGFFKALATDGFVLDPKTNELAKQNSGMRFFVERAGNKLRIADNADFLKNMRWPSTQTLTTDTAVVVTIDWRNLKPELRKAVTLQGLTTLLPQLNNSPVFSIETLPEVINAAASDRIASLFAKSESLALRFTIDDSRHVQLTADVNNRYVANNRLAPSPFATPSSEQTLAQVQWNLPIENDLRSIVQGWALQLSNLAKHMFDGDQIQDDSGLSVLYDGAALLAKHSTETIALSHLQGAIVVLGNQDRPVIASGLRVANPARLDGELQRLLKAATDKGAPFKTTFNVASTDDISLHRVELPIAPELASTRALFGETLTIHFATTSHALLFGVGAGSDQALKDLVSPGKQSTSWFDAAVLTKSTTENAAWSQKLGLAPAIISMEPSPQGFRLNAAWPEAKAKSPAQLTRTLAP